MPRKLRTKPDDQPDNQPNTEPTQPSRSTRVSTIDYLFGTKQGSDKLAEMLLALQSGCYAHTAASMIGIAPHTFSKWLKRGREEDSGKYKDLWDRVVEALSIARCQAEIKVAQTNPLHYLTRGAGRILGDNYNESLTKQLYDHNVDGSVALPGHGHLTVHENDGGKDAALPSPVDHVGKADLVAALIELRKAGVDLNAMVEQQEKLHGVRHIAADSQPDDGHTTQG
jgi:hypothetical protein